MGTNWRHNASFMDSDSDDDLMSEVISRRKHADTNGILEETRRVSALSVDSTQRSLRMISQMNHMSSDISEQLHRQNSQIDRVESDLDETESQLSIAKSEVKQLGKSSIWGFFRSGKKSSRNKPVGKEVSVQKATENSPPTQVSEAMENAKNPLNGKLSTKPSKSWHRDTVVNKNTDELMQNLDHLSEGLHSLAKSSANIGEILELQGQKLAVISEKTDRVNEAQGSVMEKLSKIIK